MSTGEISNWAGNPQEIGAMYPFVGGEGFFFILCLIFWLGWMIWQFRKEGADYAEEVTNLKNSNLQEKISSSYKEMA